MIQFRLRTLLIITAASAVMFWALFAPPQWLGLGAIYALYFLLAAAAVSGIVYHRGYWQAFFLGVMPWPTIGSIAVWWNTHLWPLSSNVQNMLDGQVIALKSFLMIALLLAITSGLVSAGIRCWAMSLQRRSD